MTCGLRGGCAIFKHQPLKAEGPLGGQLDLGDGEFRHGHAVGHPRAEQAHIAVEKRLGEGLHGAGGVEDSLQ